MIGTFFGGGDLPPMNFMGIVSSIVGYGFYGMVAYASLMHRFRGKK